MKRLGAEIIRDMLSCIGFKESDVTKAYNKIIYAYKNSFYDLEDSVKWNKLKKMGFAAIEGVNKNGVAVFSLTEKGLDYLVDYCGIKEII